MFLVLGCTAFVLACNNEKQEAASGDAATVSSSTPADLPYKATYTANWDDAVSDADLKMVLQSYKDWETGNIEGLSKAMADTASVDMNDGTHMRVSNADLMKRWGTYRDSLSSVKIEMATWRKMHDIDSNNHFVIVWYDEWDTYKNGKVDSATYHDINAVKDGKIVWYSQYKRPKK